MNNKKPTRYITWIIKQDITPVEKGELLEISRTFPLKFLKMVVEKLKEGNDFELSKKLSLKEFKDVKNKN